MDPLDLARNDLNRVEPRIFKLIDSGDINPWDIDIIKLCDMYLSEIRHKNDLRISGNALLTSAVLLKLKSAVFDEKQENTINLKPELAAPDIEIIPASRSVKRKVTVFELLDALNEAFSLEKQRVTSKKTCPKMKFYTFDISKAIEKIIQKLPNQITFTALGAITLFAILQLATRGVIEIEQSEWNGSIRVRKVVTSGSVHGGKAG